MRSSRVHVECAAIEPQPELAKKLRVLELNKLWAIEALHFPTGINESSMNCLLDSSLEVNILSYVTALSPGFTIFSDV